MSRRLPVVRASSWMMRPLRRNRVPSPQKGARLPEAIEGGWSAALHSINGETAMVLTLNNELNTIFVCSTDAADRVSAIHVVRNPDKLAYLTRALA